MNALALILKETIGLFIDDGAFAAGIALIAAAIGLAAQLALLPPYWIGPALFIALAALLAASVWRAARARP